MKKTILMPFVSQNDNTLDSNVVLGGIERFQQLVYNEFKDVIIPINIEKNPRISSKAKTILEMALGEHSPSMIFTNAPTTSLSVNLAKLIRDKKKPWNNNVRMVHIHHEPLERNMMIMGVCKNLIEMANLGVEIYMVSQNQIDFYDEHCWRLYKKHIKDIIQDTTISPAYADSSALPIENIQYDISTIGRNIPSKDPFWINRKLEKSTLMSAVMTSKNVVYKSKSANKYVEKNKRWDDPDEHPLRVVFYGENHSFNMRQVAMSHSFVSTWPLESWGITALESLSHGVPTILLTDKSNKHASEHIAADPKHIRKLTKSSTRKQVEAVINEFKELSHSDRVKISEDTKKKHNKEDWVKNIQAKIIGVADGGKPYKHIPEN